MFPSRLPDARIPGMLGMSSRPRIAARTPDPLRVEIAYGCAAIPSGSQVRRLTEGNVENCSDQVDGPWKEASDGWQMRVATQARGDFPRYAGRPGLSLISAWKTTVIHA